MSYSRRITGLLPLTTRHVLRAVFSHMSAQPVRPHGDVKGVRRGILHGHGEGHLHRGERVRG